jgi:hypothetical protein
MKCLGCGREFDIEWEGMIIDQDGDGVCSQACKKKYEKERDYFCAVILPSDELFGRWLKGEI